MAALAASELEAERAGEGGEEDEGVMCAICHGNIAPNSVALVRGCDHAFCSVCILNWATQKRRCPPCLGQFPPLWLYRRIDGTYNDYLHEESVDLLHCAVWFKRSVSAYEHVPEVDQQPPPGAVGVGRRLGQVDDEEEYSSASSASTKKLNGKEPIRSIAKPVRV